MSIYQTFKPNMANYEIPDPESDVGASLNVRDIDKEIAYTDNGRNFFDYDVLSKPTISGSNIIVPADSDNGIPIQGGVSDNNFILGNSSTSLGSQIDVVNNGRVGDIELIENDKFVPTESDIVINKDNKINSVKGIIENTALNDLFFSDMNVNAIQKTIRYNVFNATDKVISDQSENTLFIIMRSILLQFGNFRVSTENLIGEIRDLNQRVVDYCSENISSNTLQYLGYIKDLGNLPTPMDRPVYHNKQNFTYDISNLL